MILAGIDEAGYGPRLGPLCVGAAVFRGPEGLTAAAIESAVAAAAAEAGVPVDDSKRVHRPGAGTDALERVVLPFAYAAFPSRPATAGELLLTLGAEAPGEGHVWYEGVASRGVAGGARAGEVAEFARSLDRALSRRGLRVLLMARVLAEADYNRRVAASGNKAVVLFDEVAALLARAAGPLPFDAEGDVEVVCDRQGGRASYAPLLQSRFPDRLAVPVKEGRAVSSYELRGAGPGLKVRFEVDADARSAAVGLASCLAKLLREWHMDALNRYVLAEAPGVRPTAGYWTDGTRFLAETADARRRLGIDDARFVRSR